jgi:hypothetical protein
VRKVLGRAEDGSQDLQKVVFVTAQTLGSQVQVFAAESGRQDAAVQFGFAGNLERRAVSIGLH